MKTDNTRKPPEAAKGRAASLRNPASSARGLRGRINRYFARFAAFQIRRRWFFIAGLVIFTFIGLAGLPRMTTSDNMDEWFNEYDTIEINTKRFEALFGNEDQVLVLIQADDV
ncbi:MAG: hypothetical protein LBH57_08565, partial [Treponema sp.]|nr:hypothetical protein [Treponema sp.]